MEIDKNEIRFLLQRTIFLPSGSPPIREIDNLKAQVNCKSIVEDAGQLWCEGQLELVVDYLCETPDGDKQWQAILTLPFTISAPGHCACPPLCDLSIHHLEWFAVTPHAVELTIDFYLVPPPETELCRQEETRAQQMMEKELIMPMTQPTINMMGSKDAEIVAETVDVAKVEAIEVAETVEAVKSKEFDTEAQAVETEDSADTLEVMQDLEMEDEEASAVTKTETVVKTTKAQVKTAVDAKNDAELTEVAETAVIADVQTETKSESTTIKTAKVATEEKTVAASLDIDLDQAQVTEVSVCESAAQPIAADISLAAQRLASEETLVSAPVSALETEPTIAQAQAVVNPEVLEETSAQERFCLRFYRVQPGEEAVGIALRFGVSLDALMRKNKLSTQEVKSGMMLAIPS